MTGAAKPLCVALVTAALAVPLLVQAAPEQRQAPTLAVFVPDSSAAMERFTLAGKLEKAGEWSKASEIYQELLEHYRDRVVAADTASGDTGSYVSVADRVLQKLSQWPADGIAIYNGRYEPTAQQLLEQAGDASSLQVIVNRYLLTKSGQEGALRLMQLWWEQGEPAATARLALRLASILPADSPQRPQLLFNAGIAWKVAGNVEQGKSILAQLQKEYPTVKGLVAGEQTDLATALQTALQSTSAPAQASGGTWPAFGGSPDRAAVPNVGGRSDALLFPIELSPGPSLSETPGMSQLQRGVQRNQTLGVFPVCDRGQLFFQDGRSLYAVGMDGGMKLPGWQSTSVPLPGSTPFGPSIRSLALSDDSIYVVSSDLSTPTWMSGLPVGDNASALICVNRDTGERRWSFSPSSLNTTPALKSLQFASPPLVVDDQLFVAARGGQNAQFNDIYIFCLDRKTGKVLWNSYVASGPNLNMMMMEEAASQVEAGLPQLSYHAGRLYVVTNVGAIGALNALDGTPAWIRTYTRVDPPPSQYPPRLVPINLASIPPIRIFAASPAILSGGHLFALPIDGKNLVILDEADGAPIKEIPRASMKKPDTLVGLLGNQLIVAGDRDAMVVDWEKAQSDVQEQSDAVNWAMNFPVALRGRPFLTADSLFLPTDERLYRIATRHWKIEQTTPSQQSSWGEGEGPGNVLVTDEHVVLATQRRVNVYTNLDLATARLDREVAAAPDSPDPLVRYAELLFAAGKQDLSLTKFQAAAQVAKAHPHSTTIVRQRLFSSALSCATRMAKSDSPQDQSASASFLDTAKDVIATPSQAVQFHLAAATIASRQNDGPSTLSHLQAILADREQRAVLCRDVDGQMRYSSEIARKQITQLIERFGATFYQATEQQARTQLLAAQEAHDTPTLMELARRYPNSSAAPAALLAAARIQEDARQLTDAAATLRQLVQEYPNHPDAAAFNEALARVYAALPGKANIASGRLAQAAALYNDPVTHSPITLADGQLVQPGKFSEVAQALKELAGVQHATPLPDFHLAQAGHSTFGEAITLDNIAANRILPIIPSAQIDYRHAVAVTDKGDLAILDQSGRIVTKISSPLQVPAEDYAWISPNLLLLRADRQLAAIDIGKAQVLWKLDTSDLPDVPQVPDGPEPAADEPQDAEAAPGNPPVLGLAVPVQIQRRLVVLPGVVPPGIQPDPQANRPSGEIRDLVITGNRILLGTASGRLVALDAQTGKLRWQIAPDVLPVSRIVASDDFTVAKIGSDRRSLLAAVDNDTGRLVFRRVFPSGTIQNLALSDDGRLVYTTPGHLACKDLFDHSDRLLYDVIAGSPIAFVRQDEPDQLILTDSTIVASSDSGSLVRMYSLHTGKEMLPGGRDSTNNVPAAMLPQQQVRPSETHLVTAEPYVYAYNQSALRAINLHRYEPTDRRLPDVSNLAQIVPGTAHLLAFEPSGRAGGDPRNSATLRVMAFSRAATNSGESFRLDHLYNFHQDAGISSWQITEGGLYVTTADNHLMFLPVKK